MNANIASNQAEASPLHGILDRARKRQLSLGDLFQVAETLTNAGQANQTIELYKTWIAFNDANPLLHLAYFNYSVVLRQTGDLAGAVNALRAGLAGAPEFAQFHINLGRALEDCGLIDQALQQWRKFIDISAATNADRISHRMMSLEHSGRVLESARRFEEAEAILWQAIELQPGKSEAGQHWTSLRQRQCKWPILTGSIHVTPRQLLDSMSPLTLACHSDDPIFQLAKAYRYNKTLVGAPLDVSAFPRKTPRHKTGTGERLRIGYVSSDLRDHAVGFALREVLELHDKTQVEIYAYYCGDAITGDETQRRIMAVADCWRHIQGLSDTDAARQIRADDIDILVDVNGYTKHARTRIFAYRPAPVIVNFCGYPGTMASPYHHYMIADEHIVPAENEIFYTEKVLRIGCNQPIDRKRLIAEKPTRAQVGLPEDVFVFACFNGMQKITAECFGRWMSILAAAPDSVLWLLSAEEDVHQRLRHEALQRGIDPARLIFAPKAPNAQHLARVALADLFLDTFPYGAHSTAADAITVGLPILTVPGKSFAARFCASILAAAHVPELACDTPDDYVARAVGFAENPESLTTVRKAIQEQRETSVLRDIPGLARRLEELFWQMQSDAERGEIPVPDLRNLDIYYEVGANVVLEGAVFEKDGAYRQRYLKKLADLHEYEPIQFDNRLWNEQSARQI